MCSSDLAAGCLACVAVNLLDPSHDLVPGSRIGIGAVVVIVMSGPALLQLVTNPARTLAARV